MALGLARLCLGMHEQALGRFDSARAQYRASASIYEGIGDVSRQCVAAEFEASILNAQGRLRSSLELYRAHIRLGDEAADASALGWGMVGLAGVLLPLERRIAQLSSSSRGVTC
jgi:hypothetical protein